MNAIALLRFPVIAFTPNGVMPYTRYENLLRVMKHEYDMNWYKDLEIVDSNGTCAVVRSATIVKEPFLARIFGRMVEVEICDSEKLAEYDIESLRDRVIEFLRMYSEMYRAADVYDELVRTVMRSKSPGEIVRVFIPT